MSAHSELVCDAIVGSHTGREAEARFGEFELRTTSQPQPWSVSERLCREGMLSLGSGGEILSADESAVQLFGYSRWSLLSLRASHLFDAASYGRLQACREGSATHVGSWGARRLETMMARRADGSVFESEVHLLTCIDRHPGTEMLVMIRDLDDAPGKRKLEGRLGEKAVYGQICCELVHDLNNMLELIMGNMHLASTRISDVKSREFLATAEDACWHGARLVRSILQGARGEEVDTEEVALGPCLSELWPLIEASVGRHTRTSLLLCDEDLQVNVDRTALKSAILNLVVNAKHALSKSRIGEIRVDVGVIDDHDGEADSRTARYGVIHVIDDGPGIPSSILTRLFEPFFTTDNSGRGSGLGLSMVKRFAETHGGSVTVTSAPGQGTRVGIILPLSRPR